MTAPSIVQVVTNHTDTADTTITGTLSATVAGNLLLGWGTFATWPAGWTVQETLAANTPNVVPITFATKTALAGETTVAISGTSATRSCILLVEVADGGLLQYVSGRRDTPLNTADIPTITPTGAPILLLALADAKQAIALSTAPTGYTLNTQVVGNTGLDSTRYALYTQAVASPSGDYTGTVTWTTATDEYHGFQVEIGTPFTTPGMWADFRRDGFNDAGDPITSPRLVRMLPQASVSALSDNITDDVISVQIDRQADVSGGSPTGVMTVVTKNTDGKYNPDNAASPVYGLLDPGVPLWFGCNDDLTLSTVGATVYGRFGGYLKTLAPIPEPGATDAPTVQWIVEDPMARYRRGKARVAFSSTRTVKTYRQAILTAIGETRFDLDTEADTLPASGELGITAHRRPKRDPVSLLLPTVGEQLAKRPVTYALNVLEDLNKLVGTRHFINPADSKEDWYAYTTRNRQAGLADAPVAALTAMVSETQGYVHSSDGIENTISVEVRPFRVASQASEVWEYGELPFPIHTGHSRTILADFGDQVFDAAVVLGSTTGNATATMVSYGTGAAILLTTVGGDTVTHLSIDGRPVTRLDSFAVERSDAGSIMAYGEMAGEDVSSDLMTSSGLAEGIAGYRMWANAAPRKTPSVTIINHPSTMLPLDLFDVVTLTVPQLDVTGKRFEIVGIHETWEVAASADLALVTFRLDLRQTPNASALSLLTFGTSLYGGSDIFAP